MKDHFPGAEKIPWSSHGYYLPERPSFILDPLWHAGAYYVQDASSMFLEQALRQSCDLTSSLRVLDLCAAPGGKSTLIQSLINESSLLVSNEVIRSRAAILDENLSKWGAANVIITNNDPADLGKIDGCFDVIVADVPCSGSGLFRKDPGSIKEWSTSHVEHCAARQKRILSDILPSLAPGGVLIYSTCSYSIEEDEQIADFLTGEHRLESVRLNIEKDWNIIETFSSCNSAAGYRFFPDKLKGEGFYMAVFRKPGQFFPRMRSVLFHAKRPSVQQIKIAVTFCASTDHLFFFNETNELRYWPPPVKDGIHELKNAVYIKKAGIRVGEIIRDSLIPDPEWALSGQVAAEVPCLDLTKEQALDYLRLLTPDSAIPSPGWYLIRYEGLGLGWIKALQGRINNYYPKGWRILNK
jgi:16S rRNA C967 or C1407 C5-methylase (RsmB/RsmF family)/NOL1/NOP2/fmu family ribosome biogenesis protein